MARELALYSTGNFFLDSLLPASGAYGTGDLRQKKRKAIRLVVNPLHIENAEGLRGQNGLQETGGILKGKRQQFQDTIKIPNSNR